MKNVKLALFGLIGLGLLGGAAWSCVQQVVFLRTAQHATGHVLDPGPGGRHASIVFSPPGGAAVQFQSQGLIGSVQKGQVVPVVYQGDDPDRTAQVAWPIPLFFLPGLLFIIGSGALLAVFLNRA